MNSTLTRSSGWIPCWILNNHGIFFVNPGMNETLERAWENIPGWIRKRMFDKTANNVWRTDIREQFFGEGISANRYPSPHLNNLKKEMMNRWQWEQIDDVSNWLQLKKGETIWLSLTEELLQFSFEDRTFHQKKNEWWWNWQNNENDWKWREFNQESIIIFDSSQWNW